MSSDNGTFREIPAIKLRHTLDLGKSTIRTWISRGKIDEKHYTYRSLPDHGGKTLCIDPRGLPERYLERWVNTRIQQGELPTPTHSETLSHEWETAADWRKEEARKRYAFYQAVPSELSTEAKKEAIAQYGANTPEDEQPGGVSMPSWYRYRKAYEADGLVGLMPDPRPSRGTKVSDTDYARFKKLYLTRDQRSARECWRRTYGAAKEAGRDVSDFPVAQTFVNLLRKREGDDVITICRKGKEYFYQSKSPYISRDWDAVKAGDVWFSDHRLWDVFVLDTSTGEVGRPWFTPWMDARSTKILSWDVYMEHPNSDRVHLTFKRGVERFGKPNHAYVDNGKDYRVLDFAGGRKRKKVSPEIDETRSSGVLDLLGVDCTFARPYNARAKTIERKFRYFAEKMEKFGRGYAGSDASRRSEITERRRKASKRHPDAAAEMDFLCTLEEFRERVADWVDRINRTPSDGKILDGHTPNEIFQEKRHEPHYIDQKHLGILCLRTSKARQISRCEWKDSALDVIYTADWMYEPRLNGRKAYARRDPQNPDPAWIFDAESGELLGTASPKKEVPAIIDPETNPEAQEELERQTEMQRRYVKMLEQKKEAIEQHQPTEEEMDRWYDAYLDHREEQRRESGDYIEPKGPQPMDPQPHDTAAEWLDQAAQQDSEGYDDLPYVPAEPDEDDEGSSNMKIWPDE